VIGKTHAPSGFFNMGEKSLFWLVIRVGSLIAVSGIILLFPSLGLGRSDMTLSHLAHAISATVVLAAILGHIYIGSIGMEGALEGMKTGYCDLNWAKAHHDRWASEVEDQAVPKE
jgi:formate dehydrogenase subunit gamma